MIRIEGLTACHPGSDKIALTGVDVDVPPRGILSLLGDSGTGKSTLLKAILRLVPIKSGRILIDGRESTKIDPIALRRMIGMVFQSAGLFPHMTVEENVGLVLRLANGRAPSVRKRVKEVLDLVDLPAGVYGNRYPHQLSGGQQQRVGVARALAPKPSYLLMDEPFGALDAITRRALRHKVSQIVKHLSVTTIFVTHDVMEAVNLGVASLDLLQKRPSVADALKKLLGKLDDGAMRDLNATVDAKRMTLEQAAKATLQRISGDRAW